MAQETQKPQMAGFCGKMPVFPFSYISLVVTGHQMGHREYCHVLLLGFILICLVG